MKYILFILIVLFSGIPILAYASDITLDIVFPVDGENHYSNDFSSPRGSKTHRATDIMADKMTPILAAQDGVIVFMPMVEPSWGYGIFIQGDHGYKYNYIHLNNDTPGTDDGNGGIEYAYAPGLKKGSRVQRGQHIGWVGDSGNAESTGSHLHFEIEDSSGNRINPYFSLIKAEQIEKTLDYNPETELIGATGINETLGLVETFTDRLCDSGSLIKSKNISSVYFCGADGKRYAFPTQNEYLTWYDDFDDVVEIDLSVLGEIQYGGIVPFKPGSFLIKVPVSPDVFAISHGMIARKIRSPQMAEELYGSNWDKIVIPMNDVYFGLYKRGKDISYK